MSDEVPLARDALEAIKQFGLFSGSVREQRRAERETGQVVRAEGLRGQAVVARLNTNALATRTALLNTAMLSKEEELFLQFAPTGDPRYKALVDAYAINCTREISQL